MRAAGNWILIETGAGDKWDSKRTEIYSFDAPPRLPEKLVGRGVPPEKIDIVINTHLHFDHCGWNTRIVDGGAVPVFPNAQYIVQRGELEHAKDPSDRDRGDYFPENYGPLVICANGAESTSWNLSYSIPKSTNHEDSFMGKTKNKRKAPSTGSKPVRIGVIGGSGLYNMPGLENAREVRVKTPFGDPSDAL